MENINFGLEEMHSVQLSMLKTLIGVCREQGLTYFLAFGSLLGAARDHRIIPWDDSIDVVMPYADYAKLTALPEETWGEGLFLQTYDTDPMYPKYYAKLRDSRTTLITAEFAPYDINHGIYINIMPLICLADDADGRRRQRRDAKLYKSVTEGMPAGEKDRMLRLYSSLLLALRTGPGRARLRDQLRDKVLRYEGSGTKDCFALAGAYSLELALPREWFASPVSWEFEGMEVDIPCGWHEWLTLRYGADMSAPISDLQGDKLANFVSLNTRRPYTEYKGKAYCV